LPLAALAAGEAAQEVALGGAAGLEVAGALAAQLLHAPPFGPLPVQIVWFGATGGVLAGIGGVYFHNETWSHAYDYWHYSRPLAGGVVGGIGCLLFYVSITLGSTKGVTPNVQTFDAVAFALGFADKAFRSLIATLTQLLFAPGETKSNAADDPHDPG
jgi:hypothetical protein